jgi:hypothetical protein
VSGVVRSLILPIKETAGCESRGITPGDGLIAGASGSLGRLKLPRDDRLPFKTAGADLRCARGGRPFGEALRVPLGPQPNSGDRRQIAPKSPGGNGLDHHKCDSFATLRRPDRHRCDSFVKLLRHSSQGWRRRERKRVSVSSRRSTRISVDDRFDLKTSFSLKSGSSRGPER